MRLDKYLRLFYLIFYFLYEFGPLFYLALKMTRNGISPFFNTASLNFNFLFPSVQVDKTPKPNFNTGDIAWMLTSTALVLIMTPGLAFFYGGMVNKKNVISTMQR